MPARCTIILCALSPPRQGIPCLRGIGAAMLGSFVSISDKGNHGQHIVPTGLGSLSGRWHPHWRGCESVVFAHRLAGWHEYGVQQHLVLRVAPATFSATPVCGLPGVAAGVCGRSRGGGPALVGFSGSSWCLADDCSTVAIGIGRSFGRLWRAPFQRLHIGPWDLRIEFAAATFLGGGPDLYGYRLCHSACCFVVGRALRWGRRDSLRFW